MLKQRVQSAAILIPAIGLAVYYGGYAFSGLVLLVVLLATHEYGAMLKLHEKMLVNLLTLLLSGLLIADAQWPQAQILRWALALVPLVALAAQVFYHNAPGSLRNWAFSIAGAVYIGYAGSFFVRLRALDQGLALVVIAFLGTWICDSGAYFVGRAWGRHKLAPDISPKKTWEGAIAGLISGVIAVAVLGRLLVADLSLWTGALLGLALVIASTIGDLAESVIKRQVGVKDSSQLIPGHGGALDRIDSLLFVVPVVYWMVVALGI